MTKHAAGTDAQEVSVDPDVRDLIETVTGSHECAEHDHGWWGRLDELGLSRLAASEDRGGSDAGWPAAAVLVKSLARRACAVPVGESDLVGDWLLERAGLPAAPGLQDVWVDEGRQDRRIVASTVESVVVLRCDGGRAAIALAPPTIVREREVSGRWPDGVTWSPVPVDVARGAQLRLALVKGLRVVGAMESAVDVAVTHVTEREQFGRPIAKFQAVQQLVATMAAESALAAVAVDAAVLEMALHGDEMDRVLPAVAVARSCAGHAAGLVARNAHQVLGAMGTTKEHRLHRFTMAMLAWRSEGGDTRTWDRQVLELAVGRHQLGDLDFNEHLLVRHTTPGGTS